MRHSIGDFHNFAGRNAGTNAGRKRRRTNAGERAIALSDSYVLHSSFKDDIHQSGTGLSLN